MQSKINLFIFDFYGVSVITFLVNVVILGVDNSLSFHTNNRKNNFLVSREAPTDDLNDSTGAAEIY